MAMFSDELQNEIAEKAFEALAAGRTKEEVTQMLAEVIIYLVRV